MTTIKLLFYILVITFASPVLSQEYFASILDSLAVYDKKITIGSPKDGDYSNDLREGRDFIIPKHDSICCNLIVFRISTFKNFSLYCITDVDDMMEANGLTHEFDNAVLYDEARDRIFLLEEAFSSPIHRSKENANIITVTANFSHKLENIYEIDVNLRPLSVIRLDYLEDNTLYNYSEFYQDDSTWMKRTRVLEVPLKFSELRYQDLLNSNYAYKPETTEKKASRSDNLILYKFERTY